MIELERDGVVFVLRMRSGENRVERAFLEQLNRALDEVESSRGDAALVTTGDGKFYSNGLDLAGFARAGADEARYVLGGLNDLLARLLAFPVATIAAVNGHAFAAGAMLALAHDFRVMRSDRGYLCLPEIDLATGQPLTAGMYALIEARLSRAAFHEALITGRRYTAREAVERQIVNESVAEGEVLPRAIEMGRELAAKDRATMSALKRGLFRSALEVLGRPLSESSASE